MKDDMQALRDEAFARYLRLGEGAGAKAKAPGGNRPQLRVTRRLGVGDEGLGDMCGPQG